ncbi:hydroxysteroid 11-beta-dehydrogenase 1-like protein [Lepisosteus oculatus]|uniref:hydroxysteroid 11-beta-dehydrogenase 1-like protein n=1 Tax=Lepisosteus oculatus TaxID=7918 RepID=UPI00371E3DDC
MNRPVKVILVTTAVCAALLSFLWRDTFDAESLKGARVLVTGSSKGIGEQMAYHYARFGAQIVITARSKDALLKVAERCQELGAQRVLQVAADMSVPTDSERVVAFAVEKLGGLDYLVLNHIGSSNFAMWDGDVEHIRTLMQVNFLSYAQMTSSALPALKESGGAIVVVSSIAGKLSTPFVAPYTATKFALTGFFGTLRQELAMQKANVSVTICMLGLIDTESAMKKVREKVNMKAAPATEAALEIIRSGATRQKELYYPLLAQLLCLSRDFFPAVRDWIIQSSFNYQP